MNQETILSKNKQSRMAKAMFLAVMMMAICTFGVVCATGTDIAAPVGSVVGAVLDIIETAALYIGIIIVLWGGFQIILALRREDSEGISKQITTIVVGAVLVGFGMFADNLMAALNVELGGDGFINFIKFIL